MHLKSGSILEDAARWRSLASYMERWPYSPYTDIEHRALVEAISGISLMEVDLIATLAPTGDPQESMQAILHDLRERKARNETVLTEIGRMRENARMARMTPFQKLYEVGTNAVREAAQQIIETHGGSSE